MEAVYGDLVALAKQGHFDVVVHGCNCQCVMGAGIARQLKKCFPEVFEADRATEKGARAKLGQISVAFVARGDVSFSVVNGYTQYDWRGTGTKVDYDAVRNVFRAVRSRFGGRRIAYPRIGAGLGGGDWCKIATIIDEELAGEQHWLIEYNP